MCFIGLSLLSLALLQAPVPKEIERILPIKSEKSMGFGTPISLTQVLTAFHVVDPEAEYSFGESEILLVIRKSKERDLALVKTSDPHQPVDVADSLPKIQAEVFYRCYLAGAIPTVIRSRYLGLDADGDLILDGTAYPGCSGSGILDTNGRLVGVLTMVWTPGPGVTALVVGKDIRKFWKVE